MLEAAPEVGSVDVGRRAIEQGTDRLLLEYFGILLFLEESLFRCDSFLKLI